MSQIEETVAIGNVPAEGERIEHNLPPEHHRIPTNEPQKPQIVLNVSGKYLMSKPGILNVAQVLASLTCLIALVTSGILSHGNDPFGQDVWWWRYRLLIFVSVFSFLVSLSSVILRVLGLIEVLPIDWPIYDLVVYVLALLMHLVAGSLVLHSEIHFHNSDLDPDWSQNHMVAAVTCSYFCVLLYLLSSFISGMEVRRGMGQKGQDSPRAGSNSPQRFQLIQQQSNSTVA